MIILFVLLVYILGLIIFLISNAFAHCDEGGIFLGQVILAPFWFIVLPYRKIFDGASGPLIEAVWAGKPVIGSDSKSLGELIKEEKIGLTFEPENPIALSKTIDKLLLNDSQFAEGICQYKQKISKSSFQNKFWNLFRKDIKKL